ncbi:DUF1573 domain-containing protein [uncultured Microscilla sp.]|uniref:DUF1573 domain-containing protein n=1 Tax=uncultured Microscilla sp. TaxID=432653 RepID=UPI00260C338C|nr:DUF1573 domain-containing protein [uncultured Microscilla sp.]
MKLLIYTIIVWLTIDIVSAQTIKFAQNSHSFGNISEEGGMVRVEFSFTNISDTTITVQSTYVSCGCTTPEVTLAPIKPGGQGRLKVAYNPQGRPGKFHKKIQLIGKGIDTSAYVYISGQVEPHPYPVRRGNIRLQTTLADFGKLWHHQTDTVWLSLANMGKSAINIMQTQAKLPKGTQLLIPFDSLLPQTKDSIGLVYNATASQDWGFVYKPWHLIVRQSSGKASRVAMQLTAHIREDFEFVDAPPFARFMTDSVALGQVVLGGNITRSVDLTNQGKAPLYIRQVKASCQCLRVVPEITVLTADKKTSLKMTYTPKKGQQGKQRFLVLVTTNDPRQPVKRLQITANVTKTK